jgi:RNA polymerase subunit RPABC4/transcription elongation factor Spt4
MQPNVWFEYGKLFCKQCNVTLPWLIEICPKCSDHRFRESMVSSNKDPNRLPRVRKVCRNCNNVYTSATCIRVPYLWFFFMRHENATVKSLPAIAYNECGSQQESIHPTLEEHHPPQVLSIEKKS